MKHKIVYQDGDYTKVLYGAVKEDEDFIIVTNLDGKETRIGKRFIVSITESGQ